MNDRAHRYRRLAARARENPFHVNAGMIIATVFMTMGVLDALSTNWALSLGAYEVNGAMRALQDLLGPMWYVPKILLQALAAAMIVWSPNKPTLLIMAIMTGWTASVVINNLYIAQALS